MTNDSFRNNINTFSRQDAKTAKVRFRRCKSNFFTRTNSQKEKIIKRVSFVLFVYSFILSITIINNLYSQQTAYEEFLSNKIKISPEGSYILNEQYNQDVIHYSISVKLNTDKKTLTGDVKISMKFIKQIAPDIVLNLYENMNVDSVFINKKTVKASQNNRHLQLELNEEFSLQDTFYIHVYYHGTPKNIGYSSFKFGEFNNVPLVGTLNEPEYASTWFPCNDRPDDKALLDIFITNDSSFTSISNGILVNVTNTGADKTYHWKTVYPISSYLICLYSSKYESFTDTYIFPNRDTLPLVFYATPKHLEYAKKDFKEHPVMLTYFSKLFGEYPFKKEKYGVAEFLWQGGAMENQTITGIGTNFVRGTGRLTDVLAHELAHHWWGNCVGPKSWKDIWLNEGFATYSEILFAAYYDSSLSIGERMYAYHDLGFAKPVYNPAEDMFSSTVYYKGAWILHMLRYELGDDIFFRILRQYFETYKYSNASTEDFIAVCESISQRELKYFFNQWLYNAGLIKLNYSAEIIRTDKGNFLKVNVKQTQDEYPIYNFPLDVLLSGESWDKTEFKTIRITQREQSFEFEGGNSSVKFDPFNKLLCTIIEENTHYRQEQGK